MLGDEESAENADERPAAAAEPSPRDDKMKYQPFLEGFPGAVGAVIPEEQQKIRPKRRSSKRSKRNRYA